MAMAQPTSKSQAYLPVRPTMKDVVSAVPDWQKAFQWLHNRMEEEQNSLEKLQASASQEKNSAAAVSKKLHRLKDEEGDLSAESLFMLNFAEQVVSQVSVMNTRGHSLTARYRIIDSSPLKNSGRLETDVYGGSQFTVTIPFPEYDHFISTIQNKYASLSKTYDALADHIEGMKMNSDNHYDEIFVNILQLHMLRLVQLEKQVSSIHSSVQYFINQYKKTTPQPCAIQSNSFAQTLPSNTLPAASQNYNQPQQTTFNTGMFGTSDPNLMHGVSRPAQTGRPMLFLESPKYG